jgi:hypothetical protein
MPGTIRAAHGNLNNLISEKTGPSTDRITNIEDVENIRKECVTSSQSATKSLGIHNKKELNAPCSPKDPQKVA